VQREGILGIKKAPRRVLIYHNVKIQGKLVIFKEGKENRWLKL
jgi:hypothetical protein